MRRRADPHDIEFSAFRALPTNHCPALVVLLPGRHNPLDGRGKGAAAPSKDTQVVERKFSAIGRVDIRQPDKAGPLRTLENLIVVRRVAPLLRPVDSGSPVSSVIREFEAIAIAIGADPLARAVLVGEIDLYGLDSLAVA